MWCFGVTVYTVSIQEGLCDGFRQTWDCWRCRSIASLEQGFSLMENFYLCTEAPMNRRFLWGSIVGWCGRGMGLGLDLRSYFGGRHLALAYDASYGSRDLLTECLGLFPGLWLLTSASSWWQPMWDIADGSGNWVLFIHMGNLNWLPGFWLQPWLCCSLCKHLGQMNQWMEVFLFFFFSASVSAARITNWKMYKLPLSIVPISLKM